MQTDMGKQEAAKMKKSFVIVLGLILCLCMSACSWQEAMQTSSQPDTSQVQSDIGADDFSRNTSTGTKSEMIASETMERKLKLTVDGQKVSITLYDTPAANALYDMLPLTLTFEDFNGIEKISYLTDELPTEGEPDGYDPDVGDFCLYAPWGNLSIFYQDFRYSESLIKLGHIDSNMDIISSMNNNFSATLEKVE